MRWSEQPSASRRPSSSWKHSPESSGAINTHRSPQPSTEIAPDDAWYKSTYSSDGTGNCVETAASPIVIAVRDSKDKRRPALVFPRRSWNSFIEGLTSGTVGPNAHA
ncbi:DUF397 domain-containing protein [Streptomyces tendae]|uniref:DUF397 domain-containing protein n=1 Tax=Streptomyces tendae TaxID=1932 RepID=UPI0036A21C33